MNLIRPLQWPANVRRKSSRAFGQFKWKDPLKGYMSAITIPVALDRLEVELKRFDAENVELCADFEPSSAIDRANITEDQVVPVAIATVLREMAYGRGVDESYKTTELHDLATEMARERLPLEVEGWKG